MALKGHVVANDASLWLIPTRVEPKLRLAFRGHYKFAHAFLRERQLRGEFCLRREGLVLAVTSPTRRPRKSLGRIDQTRFADCQLAFVPIAPTIATRESLLTL